MDSKKGSPRIDDVYTEKGVDRDKLKELKRYDIRSRKYRRDKKKGKGSTIRLNGALVEDGDIKDGIKSVEDINAVSTTYMTKKQRRDMKKRIKRHTKRMEKQHHKVRSYTGRLMDNFESIPYWLTFVYMPFVLILDFFRIIKDFLAWILLLLAICGFIAAFIVIKKVYPYYEEYKAFADKVVTESTVDTFHPEASTVIYDVDGNMLAKLRGDKDSEYLEYSAIPEYAVDAFIAVEDRSFWDNSGIDFKGLVRIGMDAIKSKGSEIHGASTITQQLARNIFLTHEVSIERKGKEMLIAMGLTEKYSKEQIIEFYINNICYANAIYGLEAASKAYFNKESSELSLSQITYLCAIPNSPEFYNPYSDPERAIERRNKILSDMLELGYIKQTEYDKAVLEKIEIEKPEYEFNDYQSTYAIDCGVRYLMEQDGFEFRYEFEDMADYKNYKTDYNKVYEIYRYKLASGGYTIYTTLDSDVQAEMQKIIDDKLSFSSEVDEESGVYALQGALTVIDNSNGKVVALVGGRSQDMDEEDEIYSLNRAYQSPRQPGSSIKPLVVYTPALMSGYKDTTTVYNIDVDAAKREGADVQSMRGTSMTLRSALEQSKNGVAWQIFDKLGANYAMSFLNKMEFSSICPNDYYNSASLGGLTYGVSTVEMASAYSALENHGVYRRPTCIDRILDKTGEEVYYEEPSKEIYSAKASDNMLDMMKGVLTKGTASQLGWYKSTDMVAACKTGTTNDSKDGWLCGVTPYYSIAVWVGYDTPKTLDNLYGATYPGEIWKSAMLKMIDGLDVVHDFEINESLYDDDELEFMPSENLPASAYDDYLPGRDDSEELSSGYTVYDYRSDRVIGESVQAVIDQMYGLDASAADYSERLNQLYNYGANIIETIYSINYTNEMTGKLDSAYRECLVY